MIDKKEIFARVIYRHFMAEDYNESPWDDNNTPSNETEREAREIAEEIIKEMKQHNSIEHREEIRNAILHVLRHFRASQFSGGYAPLSPQAEVDNDIRSLQMVTNAYL